MIDRVYVCHTYYHTYVSFMKEFNLPKEEQGKADLIISHMSTDFETFPERVRASGVFHDVIEYDEKLPQEFPELAVYKESNHGFLKKMSNRIKYTKGLAKKEEPFVPVDFKNYKNIYVYCDSDPIGYYLNYKKIKYHAVEDGLNTLAHLDAARYSNRGHFGLKVFFSKYLNLIFIENGYSKYCIDMEVNDISKIEKPFKGFVEVPREKLFANLTQEHKDILLRVFVKNYDALVEAVASTGEGCNMYLTEPLSTLDVRQKIAEDIIAEYGHDGKMVIKPHPRDELDYVSLFPDCIVIDRTVPMEMLNFFEDPVAEKAYIVFTDPGAIHFAKEVVVLGPDFMDKYEDPAIHRQRETI